MSSSPDPPIRPLALCLQPTCVKHRWIRTTNASHIYERPERIRAVLLGAAAAVSRLEAASMVKEGGREQPDEQDVQLGEEDRRKREETPDVSDLLGSLNISESTPKKPIGTAVTSTTSPYLYIPAPALVQAATDSSQPRLLQTHTALQVVHSFLEHTSLLDLATRPSSSIFPESSYLKQLTAWALEAPEKIRRGECEIPSRYHPGQGGTIAEEKDGLGIELNQNDLYLAPGSVEAIEGCVSHPVGPFRPCVGTSTNVSKLETQTQVKTVCQAIDLVCVPSSEEPIGSPTTAGSIPTTIPPNGAKAPYAGAFCVIRPPGHHCAQDVPSGQVSGVAKLGLVCLAAKIDGCYGILAVFVTSITRRWRPCTVRSHVEKQRRNAGH